MQYETQNPKMISKTLSSNDAGENGSHQAGMLIPKSPGILDFFPNLDESIKNPRVALYFKGDAGEKWKFSFIHYNNKKFGGTRNEYRLTSMTGYISGNNLSAGDEIVLACEDEGEYVISHKRKHTDSECKHGVLKLGSGWKVIQL